MKRVEFVDEGMLFTFPGEIGNAEVEKVDRPETWPTGGDKAGEKQFEKHGYVMKYEVKEADKDKVQEVGYELEVHYDTGHLIRAGGFNNLQLGICFDDINWKNKTNVAEKIQEKDGRWRGYFRLIIKGPADPMVAWGP